MSTDYEFVWLPRHEQIPEREQHTIQSKKFMFRIVWNPRGFHLIKVLENGSKFNAGYCIAEMLNPWSQWRSIEAAGNERNCWCMRTMRGRIPPSYQLNILTRIE
jgi:hypothetical protein